jgi:clan AA aspartic protease (TIGR02281 family)
VKKLFIGLALSLGLAAPAYADGTRLAIEKFQSHRTWQTNWDNLIQRATDAGAQWSCNGSTNCNLRLVIRPGVTVSLLTEAHGRGYCFIVDGQPTADCYREDGRKSVWTVPQYDSPAPAALPIVASAPTYAAPSSGEDSVGLTSIAGSMLVSVNISGHPIYMTLDTGASITKITPAFASQLVSEGRAHYTGDSMTLQIASGGSIQAPIIMIDSLTVGTHTRTNVGATVGEGDMLLGLPVLQAIGKFTIDSANNKLVFS